MQRANNCLMLRRIGATIFRDHQAAIHSSVKICGGLMPQQNKIIRVNDDQENVKELTSTEKIARELVNKQQSKFENLRHSSAEQKRKDAREQFGEFTENLDQLQQVKGSAKKAAEKEAGENL